MAPSRSRSAALLVLLLVALSCAAAASAARYTVGDGQGWTTGVDYNNWANGKVFAVGDELVFNFVTGQHNVVKIGTNDCSANNAIWTFNQSSVTTTIDSTGNHHYICSFPNHCNSGMRLAVTVQPGTPPANGGASARLQAGPGAAALAAATAGVLVKLALF